MDLRGDFRGSLLRVGGAYLFGSCDGGGCVSAALVRLRGCMMMGLFGSCRPLLWVVLLGGRLGF